MATIRVVFGDSTVYNIKHYEGGTLQATYSQSAYPNGFNVTCSSITNFIMTTEAGTSNYWHWFSLDAMQNAEAGGSQTLGWGSGVQPKAQTDYPDPVGNYVFVAHSSATAGSITTVSDNTGAGKYIYSDYDGNMHQVRRDDTGKYTMSYTYQAYSYYSYFYGLRGPGDWGNCYFLKLRSDTRNFEIKANETTNYYPTGTYVFILKDYDAPTYTYTLKYNLNEGSGSFPDATYGPTTDTSHSFKISTTKPTRSGYDFRIWVYNGVDEYGPGDTISCTSSVPTKTIVADWVPQYKVTTTCGTGIKSISPESSTGSGTNPITFTATLKDNYWSGWSEGTTYDTNKWYTYSFSSWSIVSGSGSFSTTTAATTKFYPTATTTIKASAVATSKTSDNEYRYHITYDGNGATGGSTDKTYSNSDKSYIGSKKIKVSANGFTRTGYTFSHWADDKGTRYIIGETKIPNNITLYAIWKFDVEYFDWGTGNDITKGNVITKHLKADDFKRLQDTIDAINGTPFTWTYRASQYGAITAAMYNEVRQKLITLDTTIGTNVPSVSTGMTMLATYFETAIPHSTTWNYSLRGAVNKIIDKKSNETE